MTTKPTLPQTPASDAESMRECLIACIRKSVKNHHATVVNDHSIVIKTFEGHEAILLTRDAQGHAYAHAVDRRYRMAAYMIDQARIPFSMLTEVRS